MKKVKGMPITGSKTAMTPKAPVLTDAKETSLDIEKRLKGRATQPFTNTGGAATTPTSASPKGAKPGLEPNGIYAGKSGNTVTARALPQGSPVGYSKLPNQSKQIGGRMGFPPPARKAGMISGFKSKRNASFYGE